METNTINSNTEPKRPIITKKSHWKFKLIIFLVLLLIIVYGYGYYWYKGVIERDMKAYNLIETSDKYSILLDKIAIEYENCQQLITKEEGDFGKFEYCKEFINWVDSTNR